MRVDLVAKIVRQLLIVHRDLKLAPSCIAKTACLIRNGCLHRSDKGRIDSRKQMEGRLRQNEIGFRCVLHRGSARSLSFAVLGTALALAGFPAPLLNSSVSINNAHGGSRSRAGCDSLDTYGRRKTFCRGIRPTRRDSRCLHSGAYFCGSFENGVGNGVQRAFSLKREKSSFPATRKRTVRMVSKRAYPRALRFAA